MSRLIDADALMKEFAEFVKDSNNSDFANVPTWNDAVSLVGSAPTIEERKTGKWIRLDKDNKFFVPHMLRCSECGNILDKNGVNAGRGDANYCPECGADMRGGEE